MSKVVAAKEVVILKDASKEPTKSGLVYTETTKDKPELGIVLSFGKGVKPVPFEEGDTIVYKRYMQNPINVQGDTYNFIQFKDILGVVKQ